MQNENVQNYINTIKRYKWFFGTVIIIIIFIPLLFLIIRSPSRQHNNQKFEPKNTPAVTPITPPLTTPTPAARAIITGGAIEESWPTDLNDFYGDADPSTLQDVQSVEDLPDGTKKYTATSSNPARPNIIIAKNNKTIYQRSIPIKGADIPLSNFIQLFGQADKIILGPDFYENMTVEYIYAEKGVAIVVDKQNSQVIEQHFFRSTTVDKYIKNFSNDGLPLK